MADTEKSKELPAVEPATDEVNDENVTEEETLAPELDPPCMDLTDYKPKVDHFENIQALPDESKIEGAPNFRQVKDQKL